MAVTACAKAWRGGRVCTSRRTGRDPIELEQQFSGLSHLVPLLMIDFV